MSLLRRKKVDPGLAELPALIDAITRPWMAGVPGVHRVTTMGPKGGPGKTTASVCLALTLSELRGEVVAILDGNQHTGSARKRLVPESHPVPLPIVDLAPGAEAGIVRPEWPELARYSDLVGRLHLLSNAAASLTRVESMSGEAWTPVVELVSRAAQIVVSDMGTSIAGPVAVAALDLTDTLVIATEMTQDTLEMTVEIVSALAGQPMSYRPDPDDYSAVDDGRYAELVAGAVVVVSPGKGDRDRSDLADLLDWLNSVCAAVVEIPRDQHFGLGTLIDLSALSTPARLAHLRVAAHVASRFPAGRAGTPVSYRRAMERR